MPSIRQCHEMLCSNFTGKGDEARPTREIAAAKVWDRCHEQVVCHVQQPCWNDWCSTINTFLAREDQPNAASGRSSIHPAAVIGAGVVAIMACFSCLSEFVYGGVVRSDGIPQILGTPKKH